MTEVAQPGKPRQIQAFELRMNIIADATIDLLFTKNRVTLALTLVCFLLFLSVLSAPFDLSSSACCSPCLCLLLHRVLATDIGSCFMLFKIFVLEQCRAFTKLSV